MSTQELAEKLDVDKTTAYGLIKFLCSVGAAEKSGTRKTHGKRGKGESLYTVNAENLDHCLKALFLKLTESE